MKIVCTKEEYTALLRKCFKTESFDGCRGCLLEGFFEEDCPCLDKAADIEIIGSEIGGDK